MQVRVLFFGRLKEIVGISEERAELSEGARVEDLFARYGRRFPELEAFRASVAAGPHTHRDAGDRGAIEGPAGRGSGGL